jgi:CRP/FNR family transcriptional regulator
MHEELLKHIAQYTDLSPDETDTILQSVSVKQVARKEILSSANAVSKQNLFILHGCLRLYSINDDGKEQIIQFALENWWICDFQSFEKGNPSPFFVDAVEDSVVAVLNRSTQEQLLKDVPQLERYFRIIFQHAYAAALWRINHLFTKTGAERYRHLVESFPEFTQRIPQYMLASFLGITPEFLSMIRAKKQKMIS